jgi:hypothetical protein
VAPHKRTIVNSLASFQYLTHTHSAYRKSLAKQNFRQAVVSKPSLNMKTIKDREPIDFIPCMLMPFEKGGSAKLFLYFHANAEDLGRAYKFLSYIHFYLKMHVLAVEYPGYGVYKNSTGKEGEGANADRIIRDAEIVYTFLTKTVGWNESDIILCGRSIGSGPAC